MVHRTPAAHAVLVIAALNSAQQTFSGISDTADPSWPGRSVARGRDGVLEPAHAGIDPSTFPADYAQTVASVASTVASSPRTTSEPPLACYVTATCPTGRAAPRRSGVPAAR